MELHDRRAPSGRTGYLVSNDDVARHGAAVFHAPGEFAIVRDRAGSHHDSGDPPRLPGIVFPGVHRRPGQRLPRKRDIAQCEAAVMMGHVATVTGSLTGLMVTMPRGCPLSARIEPRHLARTRKVFGKVRAAFTHSEQDRLPPRAARQPQTPTGYLTRMTVVRRQNAPYSLVEHGDRYFQEQEGVSAPNAKSDM